MKKTILALAVLALLCVTLVLFLGDWDFSGVSDSSEAASPGESGFADATGPDASDSPVSEGPSAPEPEWGQRRGKLLPKSLPEGYMLSSAVRYKDGEYVFQWQTDDKFEPTMLYLIINGENGEFKASWDYLTTPYEHMEREVQGIAVHCWQNDEMSELLWRHNRTRYSLRSTGPQRFTMEELLEIMKGMALVEEIDPFLTEDELLD